MTPLSQIDEEARRVLGRPLGPRMDALRHTLATLCEAHWPAMRGPRPATALARTTWAVPPPLATLFVHAYGVGEPRLAEALGTLRPAQALALVVLTEIERGNAEGARAAYEAMKLFGTPASRDTLVRETLAAPAEHPPEAWLRHAHRPPAWRAIVGLALHTGRWDSPAVLEALRLVAQAQTTPATADASLKPVLELLQALHVNVLQADANGVVLAVHGEPRAPMTRAQLMDMLAEGRQAA